MFWGLSNFNADIGGDTSNVVTMYYTFGKAKAFNQNIGGWDTSKVTDISWIFGSTYIFERDIRKWNILRLR